MLHEGDFTPLSNGDIEKSTFLTDNGKSLYTFLTTFRAETGGRIRFPTLAIVQHRYRNAAVKLPDPDPTAPIAALVHQVRQEKFRADITTMSHELSMIAANTTEDPVPLVEAVSAQLKASLLPTQKARHASLAKDIGDVIDDYVCGNILPDGLPWPWPTFTGATKGIHAKEFWVIAGRPKSRKTFVALAVAAEAVREHHARVLFFTPEMPPRQILLRFIALLCKLHYRDFKDTALDVAQEVRLAEAAELYGKLLSESDKQFGLRMSEKWGVPAISLPSFDVIQSTGKTVAWIEAQIEVYRPDLVIVDSFYRQKAEGAGKNDPGWKVVTGISRSLKDLAMDAGIAIIGTHQMNRDAEGKVGSIANLALADAVGQDADGVMRVITGKLDGEEVSALINLGGREVPFDGVLINNKPCYDFSEIGPLTGHKIAKQLMMTEEEAAEEAEADKQKAKKRAGQAKGSARVSNMKAKGRKVAPLDPRADEEDETELVPDG